MGKSPKPLRFLISSALHDGEPELWSKMREQGHTVDVMHPALEAYDLITSSNCWKLFDCDGLDLAIQAARRIKYVPGEKKEKKPRKPRKKKEVEE